jgi:peptidyl-prolyl cis-trans isomerase D
MFKRLITTPAFRSRVAWAVSALIIVPFGLFFAADQLTTGPAGRAAGVVFGKEVSREAFEAQRRFVQERLEARFGAASQALQEAMVTQIAWDRIMLLEEARRRKFRVEDREVVEALRQIPLFQQDGRFAPERYRQILRAQNQSPQAFEERLRADLLVEKLIGSARAATVVGDEEVRRAYAESRETLAASFLLVEPSAFADQAAAALTEEELRAAYDARAETFRIPERLTVEYAGRTREELAAGLSVTDEEIGAFYQDRQAEFATEDGAAKPLEEAREEVRQRLIAERLRRPWTDLALELEEDLGAKRPFEEIAERRGLARKAVGPFPAGSPWVAGGPEPAVLQAASGLADGELSELIETDNGLYVARVTAREASRVPPFEEVRSRLRDQLVEERAREAAKRRAEELRAALTQRQADGLRFEEAALAEGLQVRTARFTRTQPIEPLGVVEAVNAAAFATPPGELTPVLEAPAGFVMLRPEERQPADMSGFAEAEAALRQELLIRKQADRLDALLQDIRARAQLKSFLEEPSPS